MPALRHFFNLTWDEVETMPMAELDAHEAWLERHAAATSAPQPARRPGPPRRRPL